MPDIKQVPGTPESGIQQGMFGRDKVVQPKGKGIITQINMDEYLKLQIIKGVK